jgi:hypothetical protein
MDTAEFFDEKLCVVRSLIHSQLPRQSEEIRAHLLPLSMQHNGGEQWPTFLVFVGGNLGKNLAELLAVVVRPQIEMGHLRDLGIRRAFALFRHVLKKLINLFVHPYFVRVDTGLATALQQTAQTVRIWDVPRQPHPSMSQII